MRCSTGDRGSRGIRMECPVMEGRGYSSIPSVHRFNEQVAAIAGGATAPIETPRQADRRTKRAAELLAARVNPRPVKSVAK
jgi:hypothetical protein